MRRIGLWSVLDALDALVCAGALARAVELLRQRAVERIEHQRRFARSRHAGDADKHAERKVHGEVAQVVLARALDRERPPRKLAAAARRRDLEFALKIASGQ